MTGLCSALYYSRVVNTTQDAKTSHEHPYPERVNLIMDFSLVATIVIL